MPSRNLISKLKGFFPVSHDLRTDLNQLARERETYEAGDAIIRAGDTFAHLYLIEDGWVLRARYLPGGSRQIINFALPGDFLNFNSLMFTRSEFDLLAKTNAAVRLEVKSSAR